MVWTLTSYDVYSSDWFNVVWYKGNIPKQAFILWMVYKEKLLTRKKLKQWGCIAMLVCCVMGKWKWKWKWKWRI